MHFSHLPLLLLLFTGCSLEQTGLHYLFHDAKESQVDALVAVVDGYSFLVDSGAEVTHFSKEYVRHKQWFTHPVRVIEKSLAPQETITQAVSDVQFAWLGVSTRLTRAFVIPTGEQQVFPRGTGRYPKSVGGILGIDVLRHFRLEFDSRTVSVATSEVDSPGSRPGATGHHLTVHLDGTLVPAIIDTGNNAGIVNTAFVVPPDSWQLPQSVKSPYVELLNPGVYRVSPVLQYYTQIEVNGVVFRDLTLHTVLSPHSPLDKGMPNRLLIGLEFLRTQAARVDFGKRTISFGKPSGQMASGYFDQMAIEIEPGSLGFYVRNILPSHPLFRRGVQKADIIELKTVPQNERNPSSRKDEFLWLKALATEKSLTILRNGHRRQLDLVQGLSQ